MRVIVTRPYKEAQPWLEALRHRGHDAYGLPLIAVAPVQSSDAVRAVWQRMDAYDAVMFVSGNAVSHFFALRPNDARDVWSSYAAKTRAFVTGPGSYAALTATGVPPQRIDAPHQTAGQFDSEALWQVVQAQVIPGFRLLIVRGTDAAGGGVAEGAAGVGRDWLAAQARAAGAEVEFVVAYQRGVPSLAPECLEQAHHAATDGAVWLFSSSEAIANLQHLLPLQDWGHARAVVTHPRIGQAARLAGFGVVCVSRPALSEVLASIESLQ